jgi:hypothetical protein
MTTTNTTTTMKTVAQLAKEFADQGCPAAQAWELAGKQFERDSQIVAEQQRQSVGAVLSKNQDGLNCEMKRSSRGVSMPLVTETSAVLCEGGSNAKGVQFGPRLKLYTPQFCSTLKASPDPVSSTSGSSQSSCEPDQTQTWELAAIYAASSGIRLFLPTGKTEKVDGVEVPILEDFSDRREEWVHLVREEITLFFETIAEEKAKLTAKKGARR